MEKEIEELINAGRAMIDGKGWHEIDGQCSICRRFIAAVKAAEQSVEQTQAFIYAGDSGASSGIINTSAPDYRCTCGLPYQHEGMCKAADANRWSDSMSNNLIHCPNPLCNDEGWYPDYDRNGEAEQVQCEFCYTNPNSYFNALQQSVQPTLPCTCWKDEYNVVHIDPACRRHPQTRASK